MSAILSENTRPSGWERFWDKVWARRDHLIASPRFQRLAASLPISRGIARRRASGLFDLMAGFVYSQVLLACTRLKLFDLLADHPQTLEELAPRLGLNQAAAQRLMAAAVSLKLVEHRSSERYGLGPLGAPLVGNAALSSMIEHHATLYTDLRDPVALLRGQSGPRAMAAYWPYAEDQAIGAEDAGYAGAHTAPAPGAAGPATPGPGMSPSRAAAYSALMSASQPMVAEQVIDAYPLHRHNRLLDVGGGAGTFLAAVAARAPQLQLMLFDLPAVADLARDRFQELGLAGRSSVHGGSFFDDELPRGADIASLVRVVFDHSDERALRILKAVFRALPPGGTVLLAEPMAQSPGAPQAMGDAYFGFYLLAMGRGRSRTAQELSDLLAAAGFVGVKRLPTRMPLQASVLSARVPR